MKKKSTSIPKSLQNAFVVGLGIPKEDWKEHQKQASVLAIQIVNQLQIDGKQQESYIIAMASVLPRISNLNWDENGKFKEKSQSRIESLNQETVFSPLGNEDDIQPIRDFIDQVIAMQKTQYTQSQSIKKERPDSQEEQSSVIKAAFKDINAQIEKMPNLVAQKFLPSTSIKVFDHALKEIETKFSITWNKEGKDSINEVRKILKGNKDATKISDNTRKLISFVFNMPNSEQLSNFLKEKMDSKGFYQAIEGAWSLVGIIKDPLEKIAKNSPKEQAKAKVKEAIGQFVDGAKKYVFNEEKLLIAGIYKQCQQIENTQARGIVIDAIKEYATEKGIRDIEKEPLRSIQCEWAETLVTQTVDKLRPAGKLDKNKTETLEKLQKTLVEALVEKCLERKEFTDYLQQNQTQIEPVVEDLLKYLENKGIKGGGRLPKTIDSQKVKEAVSSFVRNTVPRVYVPATISKEIVPVLAEKRDNILKVLWKYDRTKSSSIETLLRIAIPEGGATADKVNWDSFIQEWNKIDGRNTTISREDVTAISSSLKEILTALGRPNSVKEINQTPIQTGKGTIPSANATPMETEYHQKLRHAIKTLPETPEALKELALKLKEQMESNRKNISGAINTLFNQCTQRRKCQLNHQKALLEQRINQCSSIRDVSNLSGLVQKIPGFTPNSDIPLADTLIRHVATKQFLTDFNKIVTHALEKEPGVSSQRGTVSSNPRPPGR